MAAAAPACSAASAAAASAASAPSAASSGKLYVALNRLRGRTVDDIERRQADVGDLFFTKSDFVKRSRCPRRNLVRFRVNNGGGCATGERQRCSGDSHRRQGGPTLALRCLFRARHKALLDTYRASSPPPHLASECLASSFLVTLFIPLAQTEPAVRNLKYLSESNSIWSVRSGRFLVWPAQRLSVHNGTERAVPTRNRRCTLRFAHLRNCTSG